MREIELEKRGRDEPAGVMSGELVKDVHVGSMRKIGMNLSLGCEQMERRDLVEQPFRAGQDLEDRRDREHEQGRIVVDVRIHRTAKKGAGDRRDGVFVGPAVGVRITEVDAPEPRRGRGQIQT